MVAGFRLAVRSVSIVRFMGRWELNNCWVRKASYEARRYVVRWQGIFTIILVSRSGRRRKPRKHSIFIGVLVFKNIHLSAELSLPRRVLYRLLVGPTMSSIVFRRPSGNPSGFGPSDGLLQQTWLSLTCRFIWCHICTLNNILRSCACAELSASGPSSFHRSRVRVR